MGLYFYSSVWSTFLVCHIMHRQVSREGVYVWCSVFTLSYTPCIEYFARACEVCLFYKKKKIVLQLLGALGFFSPEDLLNLNRSVSVNLALELAQR